MNMLEKYGFIRVAETRQMCVLTDERAAEFNRRLKALIQEFDARQVAFSAQSLRVFRNSTAATFLAAMAATSPTDGEH